MTIQQLADAHVGHPEEIDEDSAIFAQRESYKSGANAIVNRVEDILLQDGEKCIDPSSDLWSFINSLRGMPI
ncbi:MAG: hypothetical protein IJ551_09655 [Prevotella sp.]|nr:hypothetical protein [Prevotella sp.]